MHRSGSHRRLTALATVALVTAGLVSLAPTAAGQDRTVPVESQDDHAHRNHGKVLGEAGATPAGSVRSFLTSHGEQDAAASSLRAEGPAWSDRGVRHLRMDQHVDGLRVYDSYARAAFDRSGRLVDLVENVAHVPAGGAAAATIDPADALRAAVGSLYPHRSLETSRTGRSGNTTTFPRGRFHTGPRVERVAVPTRAGGLAEGYVVQTWTAGSNELYETLVSGDGTVVDTVLRTAEDRYRIFPEDPDKTRQSVEKDPADPAASPFGWLFDGRQTSTNISGNNAHAYLDADNDNAPDAGGGLVEDGAFDATFDPRIQPSQDPNRAVAVQNLFYLNNLIHDTLFTAGFDEAAGNFQKRNVGAAGVGTDAVAAEAQDGGGTDNANFATPPDGQTPRMQMYRWSVPGVFEVQVPVGPAAGSYLATNAAWGAPLTTEGVTGPLGLADDGTGTTTDACEPLTGSHTGQVVIADRGICPFTVKAKNVQNAGGSGIIIAALADAPDPVTMGGADPTVTITGEMVSFADGQTLRSALGSDATLRLTDPAPLMKDGDLDTDIVWHEYGHGLTWRMIGQMSGPLAGAIGEGMSDVLSVVVNDDPFVGEYSASDPAGIRSHSYEGYDRTYGDIGPAVADTEVHFDGEIYGAIGWDLWKQYDGAGLGRDAVLADLVDGMNYTPPRPSYEQMRDGILAGLAQTHPERSCLVWGSFAKYGVGVGARGKVVGGNVVVKESMRQPASCTTTP